jgi:hypothetical protein
MKFNIYPSFRVSIIAILALFTASTQSVKAQQFLTQIDGWNAYVHLPDDYNDSVGKRYPLICFIPGTGECGTDPNKLLNYGPSKFIAQGHNMQFTVNGKVEKPIVISLQPVSLWPGASTINRKLDSIFVRYRCDLQRINATGLSMGGWSWDNFVDNYSPVYTNKVTSIVSMSAPPPDNGYGNMKHFALAGGTLWAFEGNNDLRGLDQIRDTMNNAVAGSARYTLYVGGHCCWNNFYNPSFTENGESIYTWMLKQKKALIQGAVSPEANAGRDSATATVIPSLPLKGNGNDPIGLPINFSWTKLLGPAGGTIANASAMQTTVSGLGSGVYKYELRVTNSAGLIGRDTVTIANGVVILPIVLEQFTGKLNSNGSVLLNWKTSTEINAQYFMVERSSDGQSYLGIAKVFASGASGMGAAYGITDQLPETGANFYRLKMVDIDGSFEYSRIVNITTKDKKSGTVAIISAFTSAGILQMNINSAASKNVSLAILDGAGKLLMNSPVSLNKGMNLVSKNLQLPTGIYYISVIAGEEKITRTIVHRQF